MNYINRDFYMTWVQEIPVQMRMRPSNMWDLCAKMANEFKHVRFMFCLGCLIFTLYFMLDIC